MRLHPLGGLDEQVHLLGLLVALLLHDREDLVTLLALLETLLVLVLDQSQLVVRLVEFSIRRVLLPRLILHLDVVRVQVLRVKTIRLLVLFSELVLVGLVLKLDLHEVGLECINLLLKSGNLSNVSLLDLLVHASATVVELLDLTVTVCLLSTNGGLETLYLALPVRLLLAGLFLVLLKVFPLLIADLSEFLGAAVQDTELFLDRVLLLEWAGELGPPERLHLLEGLDHLRVLGETLVADSLLELKLKLGVHLEVTDEVSRGLPDLNRRLLCLFRKEFVIEGRHLAVRADIVLLETLFKVSLLVHQRAYSGSKDVH